MREPNFNQLAHQLIEAGIASRHAHRAVNELRDHYDDLVDSAVDAGLQSKKAREQAAEQLGSMEDFVQVMQAQRELRTWAYRWPRTALVVYPVACLVALPALPVFAGVAHRASLLRWGTCLLAAGAVTTAIMFALQISILLG